MNMDMSNPTLSQPPLSTSTASVASMDSMSGMASTFSVNTRVTLFFTEWTTNTPATYVLTIFFLFFLGIFNRFLGALKSQLERRWREKQAKKIDVITDGAVKGASERLRGHKRKWSLALRQPNLTPNDEEEIEPLSPMPPPVNKEMEQHSSRKRFWTPSAPWSIKHDGIRSLLEFIRALIGYILMLAVMTYNVGFLFAVTGSVLLGELAFGRYTQSGSGWQEGGCHE